MNGSLNTTCSLLLVSRTPVSVEKLSEHVSITIEFRRTLPVVVQWRVSLLREGSRPVTGSRLVKPASTCGCTGLNLWLYRQCHKVNFILALLTSPWGQTIDVTTISHNWDCEKFRRIRKIKLERFLCLHYWFSHCQLLAKNYLVTWNFPKNLHCHFAIIHELMLNFANFLNKHLL